MRASTWSEPWRKRGCSSRALGPWSGDPDVHRLRERRRGSQTPLAEPSRVVERPLWRAGSCWVESLDPNAGRLTREPPRAAPPSPYNLAASHASRRHRLVLAFAVVALSQPRRSERLEAASGPRPLGTNRSSATWVDRTAARQLRKRGRRRPSRPLVVPCERERRALRHARIPPRNTTLVPCQAMTFAGPSGLLSRANSSTTT